MQCFSYYLVFRPRTEDHCLFVPVLWLFRSLADADSPAFLLRAPEDLMRAEMLEIGADSKNSVSLVVSSKCENNYEVT